jgi:hypothetical protein
MRSSSRWKIAVIAMQLTIVSKQPPLTPQQAVDTLVRDRPLMRQDMANRPNLPPGPRVTFTWGDPAGGPFGSFPPPPTWRPLNCCSQYTTYTSVIGIAKVRP